MAVSPGLKKWKNVFFHIIAQYYYQIITVFIRFLKSPPF